MEKEYIDVSYTECEDTPQNKNGDITICTDPASAAISGFFGAVNNITNSIKEYNICKQQEETKRAEIKARLKLGLAEIQAKKEIILTQMNQEHELKMLYIQNNYIIMNRKLDEALEFTRTAIEIAKANKDMSELIDFMKAQAEICQIRPQFILEQMDKTIAQSNSQRITFGQTKGYLE
ncbi:MAG: hypothetical protein K2G36_02905 [Ruminococcus sp.]|nr:hypothetical protein [Ruminococcus sp.]